MYALLPTMGSLAGSFLLVLSTATIIELAEVLALEFGLLEPFVHHVVHEAAPHGRSRSRRYLRRVFGEDLAKVVGAFSTTRGRQRARASSRPGQTYQGYSRWNKCT